jgi:hypothetical protein
LFSGAITAAIMIVISLISLQTLQQDFGLGVAEIASPAIPVNGLFKITPHTAQMSPLKENCIERFP